MDQSFKNVVSWIVDIANQADESLADGWQTKDAVDFLDEALRAPAVIKDMPGAFKAAKAGFTEEEETELVTFLTENLKISNADAKEKAVAIVTWIVDTQQLIQLFTKKKPAIPAPPPSDKPPVK